MHRYVLFMVFIITVWSVLPARSHALEQPEPGVYDYSLRITTEDPEPGEVIELIVSAQQLRQLQYFGFELAYEAERFAFVQAEGGSVFGGDAVWLARHLPGGRLAVSVSSTAGPIDFGVDGSGEAGSDASGSDWSGSEPHTSEEHSQNAEVLVLRFEVRDRAPAGGFVFTMFRVEAADFDDTPLPVSGVPHAFGQITPYFISVGLIEPGNKIIARGEAASVRFGMRAEGFSGVNPLIPATGSPDTEPPLSAEFGIVSLAELGQTSVPPDQWPESVWRPVNYDGENDQGLISFTAQVPEDLMPGTWLVAGRFELHGRQPRYAGYSPEGGGFWHPQNYPSGVLEVTVQRVVVAHWSFDAETFDAETGTFENLGGILTPQDNPDEQHDSSDERSPASVSLVGASLSGFSAGSSGRAPNSNNWHATTDSEGNPDEKYWLAELSTHGFSHIGVSFKMTGSGTGPGAFALGYRYVSQEWQEGDQPGDIPWQTADFREQTTGSVAQTAEASDEPAFTPWQTVENSDFTLPSTSSYTSFAFALPAQADKRSRLQVRWLRTENSSISGGEISSAGTNRIDEIEFTAVPADDSEIMVWPGDANASGSVEISDVLSVAWYWMSRGPARIPRSVSWAPQPAISWVPGVASHADTNGDGLVDQRDVLAIGRNFGRSVGDAPATIGPVLASHTLPRLKAGESIELSLHARESVSLLGLSLQATLSGLPQVAWSVQERSPGSWASEWLENDRLIALNLEPDRHARMHSVWAHTGIAPPTSSTELATITLYARHDWLDAPELQLSELSVMTASGTRTTPDASLLYWSGREASSVLPAPELPSQTRLGKNYPNPFNPQTQIPWELSHSGPVNLSVYDVVGRRVSVLIEADMPAGRHVTPFDASALPSGLYIYRLQTRSQDFSRSMMLVK